jgi:hypothetical protein
VCGFSAGCQAVRAHVAELEWTALVGVDGVHSSSPPDDAAQIQPWRVAVNMATASRRVVHFTASEIDPPGYRSVRDTLASIVPDWAGKLRAGESIDRPLVFTAGAASSHPGFADVMAFCYPGKDARAHELQAQVALPRALNFALCERGALRFNGPEFSELERVIGSSAGTVEPPLSGGGVPPSERSRWLPLAGIGLATVAAAGLAWWLR